MRQRTKLAAPFAFILAGFVAFAPMTVLAAVPAPAHAEAHDDGHAVEVHAEHDADGGHHATQDRMAPEDAHWWLGKVLIPVSVRQSVAEMIGPSWIDGEPASQLNVGHIFLGLLTFLVGLGMAFAARRKVRGELPPKKWGAAAFFDILTDALYGLMIPMMPREKALKYLPLMTATATFIFISNIMGLIPGLVPPTQSLNTTLAIGVFAFFYYNWEGIKAHGPINYLKHFMGPIWWLAPLIFPIEIISHLVRPASLGIRLMGNMFGDHQVLFNFMKFKLPLIPLPVMALGVVVMVVQTLVFTLLFMVYVALAIEVHEHDHAEEHGHGHGHGDDHEAQPAVLAQAA
ncbi:MAG: F-type H+-transporting ATPase subunit a [Myxococcota bacterium]|jgi:F-type H+-transporting ATPase subunit a